MKLSNIFLTLDGSIIYQTWTSVRGKPTPIYYGRTGTYFGAPVELLCGARRADTLTATELLLIDLSGFPSGHLVCLAIRKAIEELSEGGPNV